MLIEENKEFINSQFVKLATITFILWQINKTHKKCNKLFLLQIYILISIVFLLCVCGVQ